MGSVTDPEDRYFDLAGLARYSGLTVKTLRKYINDPLNPLPCHHVHAAHKDRGRTIIHKREFDAWVAAFPSPREKQGPSIAERVERALARSKA